MILMYSCMKESNHHKLEKNQNRHHFGQLPWSLKNPDGTHLALGRGRGGERGTGEKIYKLEYLWGRERQAEWSPISLRTRVYSSHILAVITYGLSPKTWSSWTGNSTAPQHTAASRPPLQSKQNWYPTFSDRKNYFKLRKTGGQGLWPIKLISSMNS